MQQLSIQHEKYSKLIKTISEYKKVAVAFSGGVDSTFLLAAAQEAIGENVIGITINSYALPRYELEETKKITNLLHIKHIIIDSFEIENEIKKNPVDRCYFCKKNEFQNVIDEARKNGFDVVVDGSNMDDKKDYRPGMKAKDEINVKSPLLECGITKAEIREFSKILNLPTWDKPAYACLFSRIPYGTEIKIEDLEKIEKSEKYFIDKGFKTIRVRCHGNLARIEIAPADREKLIQEPLATDIVKNLKNFGFHYITLDIQGYRLGSFNETMGA